MDGSISFCFRRRRRSWDLFIRRRRGISVPRACPSWHVVVVGPSRRGVSCSISVVWHRRRGVSCGIAVVWHRRRVGSWDVSVVARMEPT